MQTPETTNESRDGGQPRAPETLTLESGALVMIDQFMLTNQEFDAGLTELGSKNDQKSKSQLVSKYGGCQLDVSPGKYQVERFPRESLITLVEEGFELGFAKDEVENGKDSFELVGKVFIDTGCACFFDSALLEQSEFLKQFRSSRKGDNFKGSRDVLREAGGAVRYGFNRLGDELGVFHHSKKGIVAVMPESA